MRLRSWIFAHWREVARLFSFEEYDAPVLESEELYIRKAGEEITAQLYAFEDKGGRRVSLRPEMTPSLARMVLQKGKSLPLPIRWFSIPQCWRYERMTRGRKREHYQWNMDLFGVADVTAEAELLAAIATLFERLGLTPEDVGIRVSSRKVLQGVMDDLGVPVERFAEACVLVDKLDKLPRETLVQELRVLGLEATQVERLLDTLSIKDLGELAAVVGESNPAVVELQRLFFLVESYGFGDWLCFDASIVRGLAYYTGVVFEAFDRGATLRAICGGGRYDHLLSTFGGKDVPACGFGFGDVVLVELLRDKGLLPELPPRSDDVVFAFSEELRPAASRIATQLRATGRRVDLMLEAKRVKAAFKHADRIGARRMVMLAPDEWVRGEVRVKDLESGTEHDISVDRLLRP
jgi:histidyl-tRNA synthetase